MSSVKLPENIKGVHIHFVGIKGTGMAALVEILHHQGAVITGSDTTERFYTDAIIEKLGLSSLPFSSDNITSDIDYVIYSSAYNPETSEELKKAFELGIPCMLYSEALGAVSALSYSAGICGVHGKTTTTGLTGTLLKAVDLPSQVLAGSIIKSFGDTCTMTSASSAVDGTKYFVAETCEYRRNFMHFVPKKIILTSVESDHQDYYPTYEDIRNAFVDYICLLPTNGDLIYCADDKGAVETALIAKDRRSDINLVPYGEKATGDYHLTIGRVENGRQYFTVDRLGECAICVPGVHNVRNSAAAIALTVLLCREEGLKVESISDRIKAGLMDFTGGKRRSEIVGRRSTPCGQEVIFIDDYGHHPTAVKTTLEGYREFYREYTLIVDFMSHTYTRTQALLEEFAQSFGDADKVIINRIFGSARENASAATVTGEILAEHTARYHGDVVYCGDFDQAADKGYEYLCQKAVGKKGYVFVTMGAGDNYKVGLKLLSKLDK